MKDSQSLDWDLDVSYTGTNAFQAWLSHLGPGNVQGRDRLSLTANDRPARAWVARWLTLMDAISPWTLFGDVVFFTTSHARTPALLLDGIKNHGCFSPSP
ncbi:hypothetical protein QIS74_07151 [Colletotrichum tabaci]|uniref:Uncharacterized protein n=1 Tax=Colletotrichum tabaci TaxID=1209068 RepID=A0AAV9TC24_9PEZI